MNRKQKDFLEYWWVTFRGAPPPDVDQMKAQWAKENPGKKVPEWEEDFG